MPAEEAREAFRVLFKEASQPSKRAPDIFLMSTRGENQPYIGRASPLCRAHVNTP